VPVGRWGLANGSGRLRGVCCAPTRRGRSTAYLGSDSSPCLTGATHWICSVVWPSIADTGPTVSRAVDAMSCIAFDRSRPRVKSVALPRQVTTRHSTRVQTTALRADTESVHKVDRRQTGRCELKSRASRPSLPAQGNIRLAYKGQAGGALSALLLSSTSLPF
jgi:hypothetical protein